MKKFGVIVTSIAGIAWLVWLWSALWNTSYWGGNLIFIAQSNTCGIKWFEVSDTGRWQWNKHTSYISKNGEYTVDMSKYKDSKYDIRIKANFLSTHSSVHTPFAKDHTNVWEVTYRTNKWDDRYYNVISAEATFGKPTSSVVLEVYQWEEKCTYTIKADYNNKKKNKAPWAWTTIGGSTEKNNGN